MPSKKRKPNSSRPRKLTRAQAAAQARRQAARRRRLTTIGAVAVLAALAGLFFLLRDDRANDEGASDFADNGSDSDSSSTTRSADSVAGEPCVPMQGPAPAGAPEVPVKVGEPPDELVTEDLVQGDGRKVEAGDQLKVNYIGVACSSGTIFDSSYATGQPAEFALSQVIKGWQAGIPGMNVGGQRLLGIPPEMAYGSAPPSADIKPDETLWFVVEVLEAQPA